MSTTPGMHPILGAAELIRTTLASVAATNATFMSPADKQTALVQLTSAASSLHELTLRVLATAGEVAADTAFRDGADWWAAEARLRRDEARAAQRLAQALDRRYGLVAAGMASGGVNPAQAHVVASVLDALPDDLPPELLPKAEAHLVGLCADHDPADLRRLGSHLIEVLAPEIAEEAERKRLERLERAAAAKTRLRLRRLGDGTTRLSGLIPDASATRLATFLDAFTNPRKNPDELPDRIVGASPEHGGDPLARLTHPRRLGEAFVQLLESLDPSRLPLHGGDATTVVIKIDLDALRTGLGIGEIVAASALPGDNVTADRISAGEVRRLACSATLIPTLLGGASEVLDLGRAQRLFTAAQRRALLLRDQTCRAAGCTIPGTWAEAHHWIPWQAGGPTSLDNAVLLCHHHHQRAHDEDYDHDRLPDGTIRYHRRR
ncbi:MAG: DUF222 domain-containing protein [Nocardioides sp.]|jgi:hypothetical protein